MLSSTGLGSFDRTGVCILHNQCFVRKQMLLCSNTDLARPRDNKSRAGTLLSGELGMMGGFRNQSRVTTYERPGPFVSWTQLPNRAVADNKIHL